MEQEEQTTGIIPEILATAKKNYCSPKLVEYGNIVAVTQAMMAGSFTDGMGKLMMMEGMG